MKRTHAWILPALAIVAALAACGNQWHQPKLNHPPADHPYIPAGPGATVDRLVPLITGWTPMTDGHTFAGGDEKKTTMIPVPAFFIEHRGDCMLVDTGLSPLLATDPAAYLGASLASLAKPMLKALTIKPEWSAPAQLQKLGVDRGQIRRVILTHAHFDHTGANRDFPHAAFLMTPAIWRAGRAGSLFGGYWRPDFPADLRLELIDFHGARPFLTFADSFDLFGDGSVILAPMPGHDADCIGVFVRTRDRAVLLIGDAAYSMRNIREMILPGYVVDPEKEWDTLGRLRKLTEKAPEILIVPSHDPDVVRALAGGAKSL